MKGFIFPTPKKSIILLFFFFFAFLRTLNVYKFCIMNNLFIRKSTNSCIMSTMCVYYENIFLAGERWIKRNYNKLCAIMRRVYQNSRGRCDGILFLGFFGKLVMNWFSLKINFLWICDGEILEIFWFFYLCWSFTLKAS